MTSTPRWALMGGLFAATALGDLATKLLAEARLADGPFTIVPGWVSLRLAYNRGVAFSAFEGLPHWVLGVGALLLLGGVLWSLRKLSERAAGASALALVAAGGLADAIARLAAGRAADMTTGWKWPVFNIADTGISIGVGLLLIAGWKKEPAEAPAATQKAG